MPIKIRLIGSETLVKVSEMTAKAKSGLFGDLVTETERFSLDAVARIKKDYLTGPRPDKLGVGKGRLRSSIAYRTVQSGNTIKAEIGSNVEYAPIHEEGGTTHPNVTDRMRKFAWAMFFETGKDLWKRLALTHKSQLTVKIPARPYLRPGIEDALPDFQQNIERVLGKIALVPQSTESFEA